MDERSTVITIIVTISMGLIVVFGANKKKHKRQNDILNRAIRKTEYQNIACYCVDTMTDREITQATFFQRSTVFIANASKGLKQNNLFFKAQQL